MIRNGTHAYSALSEHLNKYCRENQDSSWIKIGKSSSGHEQVQGRKWDVLYIPTTCEGKKFKLFWLQLIGLECPHH